MIIKSGKYTLDHLIIEVVLVSISIVLSATFYVRAPEVVGYFFFPLLAGSILLGVPYIIATTRTIIMDETGYTVCWWRYQKHYCWGELKLKQYAHYKGAMLTPPKTNVICAAEFYPKKVRIPKLMNGHLYSSLFHPLTFVFICFPSPYSSGKSPMYLREYPTPYEVNEKKFRAKLKEWGVEMTEVERGPEA